MQHCFLHLPGAGVQIGGAIPEAKQGGFGGGGLSVAALTEAFQKAALDPRVTGELLFSVVPLHISRCSGETGTSV